MKYPWYELYEKLGISKEIEVKNGETLVSFVKDCFQKYSDYPMYENLRKTLTYNDVDILSSSIANYFINNFNKGDVVAIHMPNLLQMPLTIIGALRAGMIIVPVNPLYTIEELKYQLNDAKTTCIVTVENFAYKVMAVYKEVPTLRQVIVTRIFDILGRVKRFNMEFILKYIKKMIPSFHFDNMVKWSDLIKGKGQSSQECDIRGDDIAFYIYTSGTTSHPKGVILKHSNILSNVKQIHNYCHLLKDGSGEVFLGPLPLYHSFALMLQMWYPMSIGAKLAVVTNPRNTKSVVKSYRRNKCTIIIGIETLFRSLLNNKGFCNHTSFSNLKITLSGGASIDPTTLQKWYKVTHNHMITGYGITEASPCVICNYIDQIHHRDMTVGLPIPSTQVKIIDSNGNELPNGESGELIVKGPQVSCGYLNKPEETAQNFRNGWLYTGDIAQLSDDGFITIVGREKEMLNISGFCVSPYEIEEVYNKHPKISESVAVQIKTPQGSDTIKLVVIPKDKSVTKEELLAYGKQFLTNYKRPHVIEFVEEIPKSNVGKILRRLIE